MDECWRQGVAYNPLTCTEEEIKTVKAYAKEHDLWCRDMDWFIKSIFYKQAMLNGYMPEPKMIIGHNLPFDLGAISNRTVRSRDKKFYGALSTECAGALNGLTKNGGAAALIPERSSGLVVITPIFGSRNSDLESI
jgi:hypothetical protein